MDPVTMMAIGAALGLGKSYLVDKPQNDKARQFAAAQEKFKPWTGEQGTNPGQVDVAGNTLGGLLTGAAGSQSPWLQMILAGMKNKPQAPPSQGEEDPMGGYMAGGMTAK